MKKFFIAIAAIATAAACSQNETISLDNGEAISFGNAFVENSVRADVATDPSLNATTFTSFKVWGTVNGGNGLVAIYAGDDVEGTVGSNIVDGKETHVWYCDVKQYWIADAKYNFAALANATVANVTPGTDKLPASVKFAANGATDLVYARSTTDILGKASGNGPVNFTFNHLLSKVKFTVNNSSTTATGYSFVIRNIAILGATEGTCALPAKTWSDFNDASDIEFEDITVATGVASVECKAEKLLIPGDVKVKFEVAILCDNVEIGKKTYAYDATYNLAVGSAYNFTIGVAVGEEITFSVTEQPEWDTPTHDVEL